MKQSQQAETIMQILDKPMKWRNDSDIDTLAFIFKRFRITQELMKLATYGELKELYRFCTYSRLSKGDVFQKHQQSINSLFFIIQGSLWTINPFFRDTIDQTFYDLSILPPWEMARKESIINVIVDLLKWLQKKQGQRLITDAAEMFAFYKTLQGEQKIDFESKYYTQSNQKGLWLKAKGALNISQQAPKIILTTGDFFSSPFANTDNSELLLNNFVAKTNALILEIPEIGLRQLIQKMNLRFLRNEQEYFQTFPIFSEMRNSDLEQLLMKIETRQLKVGDVIFMENQESDYLYIVRQGEIEIFQSSHLMIYRNPEKMLQALIKPTKKKKNTPIRVVTQNQMFGDEQLTCEVPKRQYSAKVKSSSAIIQQLSYQEFYRINNNLDVSIIKSNHNTHEYRSQSLHQAEIIYRPSDPEQRAKSEFACRLNELGHSAFQFQYMQIVKPESQILVNIHMNQKQQDINRIQKQIFDAVNRSQFSQAIDISKPLFKNNQLNTNDISQFLKMVKKKYTTVNRSPQKHQSLYESNYRTHSDKMAWIQQSITQKQTPSLKRKPMTGFRKTYHENSWHHPQQFQSEFDDKMRITSLGPSDPNSLYYE